MKTKFLTLAAVFAGIGLQAQTNTPPSSPSPKSAPAAPVGRPTPASLPPESEGTNAPPAPAPRPAANPEARSASESQKFRQLNEALAAQKPNPHEVEKHRTTGLFPAFFRTVKAGDNPLQLFNPFAPLSDDEKNYSVARSRVFDDPKTHASPGVDIFSVSY